jgi:hypothetical protein
MASYGGSGQAAGRHRCWHAKRGGKAADGGGRISGEKTALAQRRSACKAAKTSQRRQASAGGNEKDVRVKMPGENIWRKAWALGTP